MIPREPTAGMLTAAKAAVSGYPRDAALIAVWQAMWDAASAMSAREGQDRETGLGAKPASAVGNAETPNTSHRSTGE